MRFEKKEDQVLEEIDKMKSRICGLDTRGTYHSNSIGELTRGCKICTNMKSMTFILGYRCNASCDFCFAEAYQGKKPDDDEKYIRQACLKDLLRRKDDIDGVGFTGGETMLYINEIEEYANIIKAQKPGIFLWVYTNGIDADRQKMEVLKSSGIDEIRFNLAASDYSSKVIDKLKTARDIFSHLAVEVPAYPRQRQSLMDSLAKLSYYSIDQLTLQELLVNENNINRLEGEGYQSGTMFFKKYFLYGSRKMTYEVIQHCIKRGYDFTLNDCSSRRFGRVK